MTSFRILAAISPRCPVILSLLKNSLATPTGMAVISGKV